MALIFTTDHPTGLLKQIKDAIDSKKIETWSYNSNSDFTHTPSQWYRKAFLRPKIYTGELRFGIFNPSGADLMTVNYAVYHGRFIEMMLTHFDAEFARGIATAQKSEPDLFNISY